MKETIIRQLTEKLFVNGHKHTDRDATFSYKEK
jgi:hypothetical protein